MTLPAKREDDDLLDLDGSTAPVGPMVDRFYWHAGAAATLGFLCGALAVVVAIVLQLWVGRWILSMLLGLLLLFLAPPLAARLMILLVPSGRRDEASWLVGLGRLWMTMLPEFFRFPSRGGPHETSPREAASIDARFPRAVSRLAQRVVREVMVPRPDVVGVRADLSVAQAAKTMLEHGISRAPVFSGDLDTTEGVVHVKDLLAAMMRGRGDHPVKAVARPAHFVPETKPLADLLREMQKGGFHLAVVSDEYGSVTGVVSLEDLIEELIGQIADEFDQEPPEVVRLPDGSYRVQASLPIVELNDLLGIDLPHASWNTVGGLVFGLAGRIPEEGASVELEGVRFVVERVQGRRIVTVLVQPRSKPPSKGSEEDRPR